MIKVSQFFHILLVGILSVIYTFNCGASTSAKVTIDELVKAADIGVIGELQNVKHTAGWGQTFGRGNIAIERVLFGNPNDIKSIPLQWIFLEGYEHNDISKIQGKHIWLLRHSDESPTLIGAPDTSRESAVLKAVRNPVRLELVLNGSGKFPSTRFSYRNLTTETMELPEFRMADDKLKFPVGTSIVLHRTEDNVTLPPDRIEETSPTRMISLLPGESYGVTLPIHRLFPQAKEFEGIEWTVPEVGTSNFMTINTYQPGPVTWISSSADDFPFWFNIWILLKYSPTREIIIAALLLPPLIFYYILSRRRRKRAEA